ncbi:MAG: nucleotide exchange factor GrpE [Acidobacteria bacterium]|nr:nucleotide exchange factor GrpE [Acidobacteriota bacterium]
MSDLPVDREQMALRFEAWLDEVLRQEYPPQGLAAEVLAALDGEAPPEGKRFDLYRLWEAMTTLAQEVKLQGRSFKELSATLTPVAALSPQVEAVLEAHGQSFEELRSQAEARAWREVLDGLLDLRDRLSRGLEPARASAAELKAAAQGTWLERLTGSDRKARRAAEAVSALARGYELGLERLDEMLQGLHVREIECRNQPFDPRSMSAVDAEESERVPEGVVLEVYRTGYEWKGEVYRAAQVKVARRPRAENGNG